MEYEDLESENTPPEIIQKAIDVCNNLLPSTSREKYEIAYRNFMDWKMKAKAVSATSAMSDRICIHSNGTRQVYVSEEDLLSCCGPQCGLGCRGGYYYEAWFYWQQQGISSGGPYNSSTGCKAYSLQPCSSHGGEPRCPDDYYDTPQCKDSCDSGSSLDYSSDKSHGLTPYAPYGGKSGRQLQLEIMKNGPVQAAMQVYEDLLSYKSGIYQRLSDEVSGGHAVRIIGWGVEKDTPYWLVANSWTEDWGEKGLFKIIRGTNECGIEQALIASLPKL